MEVTAPRATTQVIVHVKGNGKNFKKTFSSYKGNSYVYFDSISPGKYKVRVRAVIKKGGKKAQSKWSKFKKVTVH